FRGAGSKSEAAERATRFVQDEVRYLGFELGDASVRPSVPDLVATRRFGDCKDKALLLVTLLHQLDVDAVPVLVSMGGGASLKERLPSAPAFNHVIVRAPLEGRSVWIDATGSYERGPFLERPAPPFVMGLPVAAGVVDLEPIPDPAAANAEP